jgi:transposase-like protein
MKRIRHTPEQIIRKLREADAELAAGKTIPEVSKALGVAETTYHRWRNQYGGMKADDAKRLKELEKENARLKKLLAEAELDKAMLKELAEGNF